MVTASGGEVDVRPRPGVHLRSERTPRGRRHDLTTELTIQVSHLVAQTSVRPPRGACTSAQLLTTGDEVGISKLVHHRDLTWFRAYLGNGGARTRRPGRRHRPEARRDGRPRRCLPGADA